MENQSTQLNKAVKISIISGIIVVSLSVAYSLIFYLPQRDQAKIQELKQKQVLSKSMSSFPKNDISNNEDTVTEPSLPEDISNIPNNPNTNSNEKKVSPVEVKKNNNEYEKIQKANYEAQLKIDKEAYNSAVEKLTRDYNHAVDALKVKEASEGGREVSSSDCGGAGVQIQECAIADRIHNKYKIEYDYLEETYKANLKAVEATKYW
jgi:hypothetical protein